jgi:hypothetical protein
MKLVVDEEGGSPKAEGDGGRHGGGRRKRGGA